MSIHTPLETLPGRYAALRLRSKACYAVDVVVFCLGAVLLVVPVLDSVVSWPSNAVLIEASTLEHLAAVLLIPAWAWILISVAMLIGSRARRATQDRDGRRWRLRNVHVTPIVLIFAALLLLIVGVITVGFVIGADKGSLRIIHGSVFQVSTLGLNNATWTTITPHEYHVWNARFIREDAFFAVFGLAMIGFSTLMFRLHRTTVEG